MHNAFNKIRQRLSSFNRYAHQFEDFEQIARRERIKLTLCNYDDTVKGYYCVEKLPKRTRHHIVINAKLNYLERTVTAFHELAHFYLHVPTNPLQYFFRTAKVSEKKHDLEAEAVALILLIPQKLLLELSETPFDELQPFSQTMLKKRWEIYKQFAV